MPLFREHRGQLTASLKTTMEFKTLFDLTRHYQKEFNRYGFKGKVCQETIHQHPYGPETRVKGWKNQHIVTLDGYGVLGFVSDILPVVPNTVTLSMENHTINEKTFAITSVKDAHKIFITAIMGIGEGTTVREESLDGEIIVKIRSRVGVTREICIAMLEAYAEGIQEGKRIKVEQIKGVLQCTTA